MQIQDRVVLITGGRRIGGAIALDLAGRGADIALSYNRSRDAAEQTAREVEATGRRCFLRSTNLTEAGSCEALVSDTVATLGRLDILIHMASVYESKAFDELTLADWDASLDVDLKSAFVCAHAAALHMRAHGGGRIITFSDWVAASGRPRYKGYLAYCVAKLGVIALTQALALELAEHNILVNAIAPGPILPPPGLPEDELRAVEAATPLGRWGGPGEIAKVVAALIDSNFVTGETVRVDGGRHIR